MTEQTSNARADWEQRIYRRTESGEGAGVTLPAPTGVAWLSRSAANPQESSTFESRTGVVSDQVAAFRSGVSACAAGQVLHVRTWLP